MPFEQLESLATRDAISGAGRLGYKLGASGARLFGGGKRKQAEYGAAGARAASKLTEKYIPAAKAKLRDYASKKLKQYVGMKRGGKVRRYRRMYAGGKVRGKFRFKH